MILALLSVFLLAGGHMASAAPTTSTVAAWAANRGQTHLTYNAVEQRIYYVDQSTAGAFKYLDTTTDTETLIKTFSGTSCSDFGLTGAYPTLGITRTSSNTFVFAAFSQGKIFSYVNTPSSPLVRIAGRSDCVTQQTNAENVTATSQRFFPYGLRYDAPSNTLFFANQHAGFPGVGMILPNGHFQIYLGQLGAASVSGPFPNNVFRTEFQCSYVNDVDLSDATGLIMVGSFNGVWAVTRSTGIVTAVTNPGAALNLCTNCAAAAFSAFNVHITGVVQHPNAQAAFYTVWDGSGGVWQMDLPFNQVCRLYAVSLPAHVVLVGDTTLYGKSKSSQGFKITDLEGCAITWTTGTQDPAVAAFCDDIANKCTAMATECDTIRTNGETAVADDCDDTVASCNAMHGECIYKVGSCPLA